MTDEESRPRDLTDAQRLAKALLSPFGSKDIPLRLTVQFLSDGNKNSSLETLIHVDVHAINFEQKDGKHSARLELLLTGFDESGHAVESANQAVEMNIPDDQFPAMLEQGLVLSQRTPVKRSGAAHVLVAVRDTKSGRIGSTSDFIVLPDLKKNRMVIGTVAVGKTADGAGLESPAVRVFRAGKPIPYRFSVLNPKKANGETAKLETQVRVFRDGREVWASAPAVTEAKVDPNARKLVANSALHLPPDFGPGEYYLEVTVKDLLAGKRAVPVTQWINFDVRAN